ncbi:MAG: IMP cyclohydrolase [Candidatus Paceibacterota bacterium]
MTNDINFQKLQAAETAATNAIKLGQNPYPGDGIIIGVINKFVVQIFWMMKTNADEVVYEAMRQETYAMPSIENIFAVSNGTHTKTLLGKNLIIDFKNEWSYKPDAPNYTPRIAGLTIISENSTLKNQLAIIRKSDHGKKPLFAFWNLKDIDGYGYCLNTYSGSGNPLPAFKGEPYLVPLQKSIEEVFDYYWNILNSQNNLASLIVKKISIQDPIDVRLLFEI